MAQLNQSRGQERSSAVGSSAGKSCRAIEPSSDGFTFVELLIAATMISVLVGGLSLHLRGGLTVWRRVTTEAEQLQRRRTAWQRLERDLAQAIVYDPRESAYEQAQGPPPMPEFGASSLSWYTVVPARGMQPAGVRWVTYACTTLENVPGLWRRSQTVSQARIVGADAMDELVWPGCESLALRYAYHVPSEHAAEATVLEWEETWPKGLTLPRLIDVTVTLGGAPLEHRCEIPIGVFGKPPEMPPA